MPDWESPAVLQATTRAFDRLIHAFLAIYTYEWLITLGFEWEILTGKTRFRWPLIFYFAGRYFMLFTLIGIVIATDTTIQIDCQALSTFIQIVGNASVGFASINLAIRTMAVWLQNRYINAILIVVILGHWSLILQGVLVKAVFGGLGCNITWINTHVLAAFVLYTMGFDFLVLSLVAHKLFGCHRDSRLGRLIFEDGLIYFVIAFLANLVSTVFMLLHLNQDMSIMFNFPSAVASTIVACRVVRRLQSYQNVPDELWASPYLANSTHSNIQFSQRQLPTRRGSDLPGVIHVQVESFTQDSENRIAFCDLEAKSLTNRTGEMKG